MRFLFFSFIFMNLLIGFEVERPTVYKNQSINGWFMSEKLDGIRAIWDGKNLKTKNGNIIHTPKDFTHNFPPFYLDGELWTKRNDFENIQSIVLDKIPSKQWEEITYNIFEVPYAQSHFNKRLQQAKTWFQKHSNKNVRFIKQIICKDKSHLDAYLKEIVSKKGEGIIIKNPLLDYVSKRSNQSLKVKTFEDMEGIIRAINFNQLGNMKSLVIKLDNGIQFNLGGGFTKEQRKKYPNIGETVTFKYYGWTKNGKPKFASFLRVRQEE